MLKKLRMVMKTAVIFGLVVLLLASGFILPAVAAGAYPFQTTDSEVAGALDYLRAEQATDGRISDFATSAWVVMAVAAAGEDPHDWRAGSNPSLVDYLADNANSASSVNDYSRMVLAIVAAGQDPANFGGRNFLTLLEAAYDGTQIGDSALLNDDFWGVMALIAAGQTPATSDVVEDSVSFILNNQYGDGGWSWGVGQDSDVDDTAAAVMALIAAGESPSSTAVADALAYIKSTQMSCGGFESWGSTNSATDSWAIASIAAAGQNPTAAAWTSSGRFDPVDSLLTFHNADGSFNWTSDTPSNKALMTSYALVALLGIPYPVAVQEPEEGVVVGVRIEGQSSTVWRGNVTVTESEITDDGGGRYYFAEPTVLGALDEASKAGDFSYAVKNTAYGLYVYSIGGEEPVGLAGWTYRVDYYSPMVGAADFLLDQTTPPTPPHQEILFAYAEWGQSPLKIEVDNVEPAVGEQFTLTVSEYSDDTDNWLPSEGATVYADHSYTTGADGMVDITIDADLTLEVYSEKNDCIRSNRVTVTAGTGSSSVSQVSLEANIIPAIGLNITPSSIDFGTLGPRDISNPQTITATNTGAWPILVNCAVTDGANGLYDGGIMLDGEPLSEFSDTIIRGGSSDYDCTLTVPEYYPGIGEQIGALIFWAEDGS